MKFGGSSLAAAPEIERVTGLVRARLDRRPLVVVSAMARTTRSLLAVSDAAARGDSGARSAVREEIRAFHDSVGTSVASPADRPHLAAALDRWFADLDAVLAQIAAAGEMTPRLSDAVVSFGELLSSEIFTLALRRAGVAARFVDCREVLNTDGAFTRARPLYPETEACLKKTVLPILERGEVPVIGGYVGRTLGGITTTLGFEGSDFSAAIFGAALGAQEIQIWTDVDGILSADPRLYPTARRVPVLSFAEGLELAWSGSKKPHPGTLEPARHRGVPIRILSSLRPEGAEERSTRIGASTGTTGKAVLPPTLKSIACRRNSHLLRIYPLGNASLDEIRPAVHAAVERVRPALLPLGEENGGIDLALDSADHLAEVLSALPREIRLEIFPGREVVSLISEDLAEGSDLATRTLAAAAGRSPRLVLPSGAEGAPAVRLLAEESEIHQVVAHLHRELLGDRAEEAGA
ncbi:MAG TPA: aspartate kinase [Thermoanaerobaculia bacterium]|nr:aspartate kinase [Thermoanaerobaculia bacterium]